MSDKKNIDRLFQEKFKDFEAVPNDAVWNRINKSLPNKKKKRRIIALWWQIGGVAAVIAILLTVGVSVFDSNDNNSQEFPIVNTDKTETENIKGEDNLKTSTDSKQDELKKEVDKLKFVDSETESKSIIEEQENNIPKKDNVSNQLTTPNKTRLNAVADNFNEKQSANSSRKRSNILTITNKDKNTKVAANTKSSSSTSNNTDASQLATETEIKSAIKKTIEENETAVAKNTSSNKLESNTKINNGDGSENENTIIEDPKKQSIEDAIAISKNTDPIEKEEEDEQNRWSIAPNVAPVYFGSLGQGSPIHSQFNGYSKSSDVNMSYGIAGSYNVSKKIKIRTGVNRVNLNHLTTDVVTFTGGEVLMRGENTQISNVKFKDEMQSISFMKAGKYNLISKPDNYDIKNSGEIDQRFGFIEVPLELEYKLVDKKFGINIIGGFSTFFLSNNEIYADIDGASTLIGEANNINDTSFSANFGLGLDYSLTKQWNINLEPTFKYQINTFNNTSGNFKPFFVGVYTGLSFKF